MTQSPTEPMSTSSFQESQKLRRKQAKRISKLRLQVEKAKGDTQKAEQRIAKARVDYEVASARLRTLEEELSKLQENQQSQ